MYYCKHNTYVSIAIWAVPGQGANTGPRLQLLHIYCDHHKITRKCEQGNILEFLWLYSFVAKATCSSKTSIVSICVVLHQLICNEDSSMYICIQKVLLSNNHRLWLNTAPVGELKIKKNAVPSCLHHNNENDWSENVAREIACKTAKVATLMKMVIFITWLNDVTPPVESKTLQNKPERINSY